jgi:hypothetical protein
MRRHVPDEALADLAEGGGTQADRTHAAGCAACAARVEEMRAGLALVRRADVPDPPPPYWEAMRRSVGRRIAEERHRAPRWAWLVPAVSVAAVVAVVVFATWRTRAPSPPPPRTLAAWSALPPEENDPSLEVLEGLVASAPELEELEEGRGLTAFLAGLSDEDYRALADSLRGAAQGGES